MNTKQLSYILAIAQNESLSAASAQLGVSQPALSKYLAELEEELGTDLFLRYKKKLYLTSAGRIYADAARRIISVKEQTYQTISSLSNQQAYTNTLTVGVTPLRGAMKVAQIYPAFRKRYPYTNIVFKEQYNAQLRQSTMTHQVNMALGTCIDLEDPELNIISAYEEDLILFVSSFHPLAARASKDLNNLTSIDIRLFQDTPFVLGGEGSTIYKLSQNIFKQMNMNPTIVFRADNNLVIKNMVASGAGVGLLPHSFIEPSRQMVYFSLHPSYHTHIAVLTAKDRPLSEEERYLIALFHASDFHNPYYRFNPTSQSVEILKEFHFDDRNTELFVIERNPMRI